MAEAIAAFFDSLRVLNRDEHTREWAAAKLGLGRTYARRVGGDRSQNQELTISLLEDALTVYGGDGFPRERAITLLHIGMAYQKRGAGPKLDNLARAVQAYSEAEKVFDVKRDPHEWRQCSELLDAARRELAIASRA